MQLQADLARGLLLREGKPVALRSKAFDLVPYPQQECRACPTKSELMSAVWPDVFVTEDSLTQAVRELRKALQDESQTIVRTVAKRGYVFSLPEAPKQERAGQPGVSAVRFSNEGAPEDTPLIDGFAEDMVNALAGFGTVVVLARNSGFALFGFRFRLARPLAKPSRDLYGPRQGDHSLRRHAGRRQSHCCLDGWWLERYFSASSGQIFDMQEEIARRVVNRLVARLDEQVSSRQTPKPPARLAHPSFSCVDWHGCAVMVMMTTRLRAVSSRLRSKRTRPTPWRIPTSRSTI